MNLITSTEQTVSTQTTCPYCGVGCGVTVNQKKEHCSVAGRETHPANFGQLCVKGAALHKTIDLSGRLLSPMINGHEASWEQALTTATDYFKKTIATYGPDSVAFYLSGQLLTEDYYVANKLMKGFIGSANIDTNSRLCMASAVVAHKRAFGADVVPGCYEDLEQAKVVFLVGSNTAYAHPILFQRLNKAKKKHGTKVVVIDPRRTATCDIADLHLAIKPGTDAFFYNGLLVYLTDQNALDKEFIKQHTNGFNNALAVAQQQTPTLEITANLCDIPLQDLEQAYQWFAENNQVVSLFSQGINQSSSGVDKGNAIINCHLATGKIGKIGSTPFSITGQPNAMGGREVGGLANQLAAHMGFEKHDIQTVSEFWQAPNIATQEGLKAVDLFSAIGAGKVKAVWIMGTNPVVSMPNANKVKAALEKCDMVVVSDCMVNTDTQRLATISFPATTWGEKYGTVTNSERTISLQKPFLSIPGNAKHDWQIICAFAKKLGYEQSFNYQHSADIFAEHARLSGYKSHLNHKRAFNISQYANIDRNTYHNLQPTQWPIINQQHTSSQRLFENGQFFTADGRAQFVAIQARLPRLVPKPDQLIMNTGRIRDQWHTMTRTGKVPRLLAHTNEPFVEIHPQDAQRLTIKEQDIVECHHLNQRYLGKVKLSNKQRLGEIFVPMHWNDFFASHSRVDTLITDIVDPISGQPEFKHQPVSTTKYAFQQHGLLLCTSICSDIPTDYWSKVTINNGLAFYFADKKPSVNWESWIKKQFSHIVDWTILSDGQTEYRTLGFIDGVLEVVFISGKNTTSIPDYDWLSNQLGQAIALDKRFTLLAGKPSNNVDSPGAIICSCFQVGVNTIKQAIKNGAKNTDALGKTLQCGTNCGSCIPELSDIIKNSQ